MLVSSIFLIVGFLVLFKGADFLIKGSSSLAKRNGISDLAIGLTVVSLGTSLPEILVSILSAFRDSPDTAVGNVLGSNNFNTFFVLGVAGLIYPLSVFRITIRYQIPLSLASAGVLYIVANNIFFNFSNYAGIDRWDAVLLLMGLVLFLIHVTNSMKRSSDDLSSMETAVYGLPASIGLIVGGVAMLIIGGEWVVDNALSWARYFNLSDKIIGLTVIAVGTSLPELVTSIVAASKRNVDIAVGNVVGSNIYNIFGVLGITGIFHPIRYNPSLNIDISVFAIGTVYFIVFMFTLKSRRLDRPEAFILLMGYLIYIYFLIAME